jgi:rhodanese-related sulfurtransferase
MRGAAVVRAASFCLEGWRPFWKFGVQQESALCPTGVKSLVEAAEREIENLSVEQALALYGRDDVLLVDIRDIRELQRDGKVPGAFHCPRGMLEFWIDPQSPYHKAVFAQDKKYVFFCAGGMRSALAAQTAQMMGLRPVAHIRGGFGAWRQAGGPVEELPVKR